MSVQPIILAGGRNERLRDIVPAYMKPLMLVNQRPIIQNLVKSCMDLGLGPITVVASPMNVGQIYDVLKMFDGMVYYIVQPNPTGPRDALWIGLRVRDDRERVMVLCADNVIPIRTFASCMNQSEGVRNMTVVCTSQIEAPMAFRFTRIRGQSVYEGARDSSESEHGLQQCWVGPVLFDRSSLIDAMDMTVGDTTGLLSPIIRAAGHIVTVVGDVIDIGTPESVL